MMLLDDGLEEMREEAGIEAKAVIALFIQLLS